MNGYSVFCEKVKLENQKQIQIMNDEIIYPIEDHFVWIESLEDLIKRMSE